MALVLFDQSGSIGKITLNDPSSLNAMSEEMAQEFSNLVDSLLPKAQKLRAIIITGAGRAFSAGGDLDMLERKTKLAGEENRKIMLKFYDSFLKVLSLKVPLIAAINGHAIGAGLCLASACDVRIAVDKAKLGFTFARLGLHPGMGATYFLPRIVGYARATELMITGRIIDALEAYKIGLVSQVVDEQGLEAATNKIVGEISECGPQTIHQLVESLRTGPLPLQASLEREESCQSINYTSAEFLEGVQATREKRKPSFGSWQ